MRHPHPGTVRGLSGQPPTVTNDRDVSAFAVHLDKRDRVVAAQTEAMVMQASWITYDGNRLSAALAGVPYDPAATKPSTSR